jgi:hypothetical protein
MSERNPFRQNTGGPLDCEAWETLLADALDGVLSVNDEAVFTTHTQDCAACAEMLAQAKQGQEWLRFLHEEPQAPADLVTKILGRTSGAMLPQLAVAGGSIQPAVPHLAQMAVRRAFRDTRLLMTVAMAFFSIALTLNLAGVNLKGVRLADLKPSALQTTVARQFYGAKKQMVSYYENLRLVYELESRMRELRREAETEQRPSRKDQKDDKQSHKNGGKVQGPQNGIVPTEVLRGQKVLAGLRMHLWSHTLSRGREADFSPSPRAWGVRVRVCTWPRTTKDAVVAGKGDFLHSTARYAARHQTSEENELAVRNIAAQAERSLV